MFIAGSLSRNIDRMNTLIFSPEQFFNEEQLSQLHREVKEMEDLLTKVSRGKDDQCRSIEEISV